MNMIDNLSRGHIYQLVRVSAVQLLCLLFAVAIIGMGMVMVELNILLGVAFGLMSGMTITQYVSLVNMALCHIAYLEKSEKEAWSLFRNFSERPLNELAKEHR